MKFIIRGMFAHRRKWLLMTKQLSPGANSLQLRFCGKWCETGKLITAENSNPLAEEFFNQDHVMTRVLQQGREITKRPEHYSELDWSLVKRANGLGFLCCLFFHLNLNLFDSYLTVTNLYIKRRHLSSSYLGTRAVRFKKKSERYFPSVPFILQSRSLKASTVGEWNDFE